MDKHYIYIVKCKDGSLYTGYAKIEKLSNIIMVKVPNIQNKTSVQLVFKKCLIPSEALKRE